MIQQTFGRASAASRTGALITPEAVAKTLGRHFGLYRYRSPHYQTVMLRSLRDLWRGPHDRLLDVGGGTGVIAQCIADLFPVDAVTSVDVENRFCDGLTIASHVYDGERLPFTDGSHDAATINNVVHHVPVAVRAPLFHDIARVVDGPLYIKDHATRGWVDDARLTALDMIGNIAFAGMVRANYLSMADWEALAAASGYRIAAVRTDTYRHGLLARVFPNRLEIAMRWERR
ncbi:class I SAM-dependent methyltransferase [Sphingomonas kyungheensis]|uniref:Class I SAM-dependent methyltransferase n=1 Tax=Sphingomonas kyungheensis TaxID=1069987 RepID=A0ABU8H7Z1_9SPHN